MSEKIANLPIVRKPDVCEIVSVKADHRNIRWYTNSYTKQRETFRVTGWLKSWTPPQRKLPEGANSKGAFGMRLQAILDQGNREFEVGGKMTRLVFCTRDEAEFIEVTGACSHTFGLDEVDVVGLVPWDAQTIEQSRREALMLVGEVVF